MRIGSDDVSGRFFINPAVSYFHVHYAKRGCYSGRIERVLQDA